MKKMTLFLLVISFNLHAQEEPLPVEWMMKASVNEHKVLWEDIGYKLVKTNDNWCTLVYEIERSGLATFVDFNDQWSKVDEVILTFRYPEKYGDILQYAIEHFTEEKSDGVSRFFVHPSFTAIMGFSTREYESGKVYMIRITTI